MIIEPVENFDLGAGGGPVSEVRLPAFVGLFGGEAAVGASGALAWFWGDQDVVVQDAAGGGGDRHRQAMLGQMGLRR